MRAEVLKGHLDMLLLASLEREPRHGYAIVEEIRSLSEGAFELGEGTVYPALYRLEATGLLASRWTKAAGRSRRLYRLTGRGRKQLVRKRSEWQSFVRAVEAVVVA